MSEENWYRRLVERFGSAVPAAAHLQIRADLQPIVDDLFAELADFHHACRVYGIVERDAALIDEAHEGLFRLFVRAVAGQMRQLVYGLT